MRVHLLLWLSLWTFAVPAPADVGQKVHLVKFAQARLAGNSGLDPTCRPADLDGDLDVDLADAGLFQQVFTGPRGGGSGPVLANPYLFTGRRLDFDIREPSALSREPSAGAGGRSGRALFALYDSRARA